MFFGAEVPGFDEISLYICHKCFLSARSQGRLNQVIFLRLKDLGGIREYQLNLRHENRNTWECWLTQSMSKQYLMRSFVPFFIFIVTGRKFNSVLKNTYIGE